MRFVKGLGNDLIWSMAQVDDEIVLNVAPLEKIVQRKTNAWYDPTRRQSKRLYDLAEIAHMVESHPQLWDSLTDELKGQIDQPVEAV